MNTQVEMRLALLRQKVESGEEALQEAYLLCLELADAMAVMEKRLFRLERRG